MLRCPEVRGSLCQKRSLTGKGVWIVTEFFAEIAYILKLPLAGY